MKTGNNSTREQTEQSLDWKLVLIWGLALGALAGVLSMFGKTTFNWVIPGGMMIASWIAVNKAAARRFWAGFAASLLAGVAGWLIYLAKNYSALVAGAGVWQVFLLTAAFLVPLILIVCVFGSWVFSRTRERVQAARERMQQEKAKQQPQFNRNRPKRKYKKKKK